MKMQKYLKGHIYTYVIVLVSIIFYGYFFFLDGVVIAADSETYIGMDYAREPFYSLYLAFFRMLFPDKGDLYLEVAVLVQSLLAALAAFSITDFVIKECKLPKWLGGCILLMPLASSLLCRFAAKRMAMYSNNILTEGITISLYLLFIRFCFEYYLHHSKQSFLMSVLLCVIGISTRKQMVVMAIVLMLVEIALTIRRSVYKALLRGGMLMIGIVLIVSLFDCTYNYILRGEFAKHSQDNRFVATMIFYTAEREYGELIEDEEARNLFYKVYDECEEQGFLMHSSKKGWNNEATHFADNYDFIQLDTMQKLSLEYVDEVYSSYNREYREQQVDRIQSEITHSLIIIELPRLLHVFYNNLLVGFVTTVAKRTEILNIYSVFAYTGYLALLFVLSKRKKESERIKKVVVFSTLVLVSILVNVFLVSAVIFCQTRYTIYNMALFYIAVIMMLYCCKNQ